MAEPLVSPQPADRVCAEPVDSLRTSSYTVYVDLPESPDEVLIVHGYTGAYDRVHRRVADFLKSREPRRRPKPLYGEWSAEEVPEEAAAPPSDQTIELLKKRGYLTDLDQDEEAARFVRVAGSIHRRELSRPSFLVMPTYDCNLRCSYCFQDEMRTDPARRKLLRLMPTQVADRIFEGMRSIEESHPQLSAPGSKYVRRIGFFGGEPLMEETRPIVEYVCSRAREEGPAAFWAVSNATGLQHFEDLLGPDGIAEIQVTLDGPPAEHDQRRIYADGSGSFERIARNVSMALDLGVKVVVRVNVDRNNGAMLPALAEELEHQGWHRYRGFSVYTAPIWAANSQTDPASTFGSWELDREIERLRAEHPSMRIVGAPDDGLKSQVRRIFGTSSDPMPSFRASYCAAHGGMFIFDAFGDVYACWEYTGDSRIRIGRLTEDGTLELNVDLSQQWRTRTVTSNPVCRKCRYALYCGGGCAVRAMKTSGEFFKNYCDSFQKRFRTTVKDAYADHVAGREALHQERVCDL